jgi:signal transduction histidine kinase
MTSHAWAVPGGRAWKRAFLASLCLVAAAGRSRAADVGPSVEFTRVPRAGPGGPNTPLDTIEGRVVGARPGQRVVVFARSGAWWVQPFADQPFTSIGPDSRWKSRTHSGTEYAALLVEPGYEPPATMDALPSAHGAVVALAVTEGAPVFWRTARFQLSCVLACALALLVFYRWRLHQLTRQLNLRFEERLAERTRIARELHDTLLQGFLSASMQLHVAVEQVPADSPARPGLGEPSS